MAVKTDSLDNDDAAARVAAAAAYDELGKGVSLSALGDGT